MKKLILSFLFLLLTIGQSYSQEILKVRIDEFHGGQNSFDLATIIDARQGENMQNVVLNHRGFISKRTGQDIFCVDNGNIAFSGIGLFSPDTSTDYIVVASGTLVLRAEVGDTSWTPANTGYPLTSGYDTEFIQANNKLFILNGQDYTPYYDGSNWYQGYNNVASAPTATTGAWLRNYLFLSGQDTHPDWVYFSDNLSPEVFDQGSQVFRVNTGDGQVIKRLEPFRLNELIIYKEKSIFNLDITGTTPLTDWTLQPVSKTIGCISPRSVVNIGNDHIFLSNEPYAVRSLSRTSYDKLTLDMLSAPIQDYFDGTGDTIINKTYITKACAVLYDNKYILAVPTGTSTVNNTVLVYDLMTKSWYEINGWYPSAWIVLDDDLYYTDALDGRVLKCFTNTGGDFASGPVVTNASEPSIGIGFLSITKAITFDNPNNFKGLDSVEVEFKATGNYNAIVYINIDDNGWQEIGSINLASNAPTLPLTLPFTLASSGVARKTISCQKYGEFKKIQVKVTQSGLSEECELQAITVYATMKPWRRE